MQPIWPTVLVSAAQGGRDTGGTPLTFSQLLRTSIVAFAAAALFAQAAAAGGEPKNEWPFTRPVGQRTTQGISTTPQSSPAIQGEPKNQPPFTRPATVVVVSSSGFDWTDGGIGAATGLGIALSAVGLFGVARRSPRIT